MKILRKQKEHTKYTILKKIKQQKKREKQKEPKKAQINLHK